MYSDYFKYLEKIKGDILPFPNSAWDYEFDAVFTGTQSFTINKPQTITPEWQCMHKSVITPNSPESNEETIYGIDFGGAFLSLNASLELVWNKNGVSLFTHPDPLIDTVQNIVEIWMKIGGIRLVVNGVSFEGSVTWLGLTWNSYSIGARVGGTLPLTANLSYFKDCDETFNFRNESLVGSLGTIPVETGVITFEAQGPSVPIGVVVLDTTDGIVKIMTAGGLVPV